MLLLFAQGALDSRYWASPAPAWASRRPWPGLHLLSVALVAAGLRLVLVDLAIAAVPPSRVGTCSESLVLSKRFRMVPSPGDQDYQRTTDPFGKEVIISLTNGLRLFLVRVMITSSQVLLRPAIGCGLVCSLYLRTAPRVMTGASAIALWICKRGLELRGWTPGTSAVAPRQLPPKCFIQAAPGW